MSGLASFFSAFLVDNNLNACLDYNESIAAYQQQDNSQEQEEEEEPVDPKKQSWAQWRASKNQDVRIYMEKRMIPNDDDDEEEEDSEEEKIPHVDDTVHECHAVVNLDLSTRTFSLSLGLVKQVWPLRLIPRREYITSNYYQNDGPLATLFKKVVCLHVTQVSTNTTTVVRDMAHKAFGTNESTDIYIYFYNKYAQHVSDFLERQDADRVLISLENIPAKCIFPTKQDYSWNDGEIMSPYCVCIGDKSSMKLDQDGVVEKIPFDDEDVTVTLARIDKDSVAQVQVTHDSVRHEATVEYQSEETLETEYQEWETKRREQEEKETAEQQQAEEEEEIVVEQVDADADAGMTRRAKTNAQGNDGRAKKKAKTETKYHSLNELRDIYNARKPGEQPVVNVMCAVLGFSTPTMTRGFDYQVNVTLVDESVALPTPGDDVVAATGLSIFCKEKEALPRIIKAGDVLRCHRVAIQEWNDAIQLLGRRSSSYVVVRPQNIEETTADSEWDVVPTSRGGGDFPQTDREHAVAMWQWAQLRLARYPTIHKQSAKLTLSDLAPPEQAHVAQEKTGDLTVMVSAIIIVPETLRSTSSPLCFLRVWDGTGSASSDPLPTPAAGAGDAIKDGDPPSTALQAIATAVERINAVDDDASTTLEPPKCLCGRVMNVAVWEEPDLHLIKEAVTVGAFIRLRNVQETRLLTGLRCLNISSKSYLTPLPNTTYEVKELLENHQRRVLVKDPFNPESGVLPLEGEAATAHQEDEMEVDEEEAAAGTEESGVASIAKCISEAAPSSFEVKFHITGTIPAAEEVNHPLQCLCRGDAYQFAVNVNDETAAIDALVPDAVGKNLFQMEADAATTLAMSDAIAAIKDVTRHDKLWKGEIRSFELNGCRFFILDSIEAA